MQAVKNQINSMKIQAEESEERVIKFESALRTCKQHLETALKEKEQLTKRIENVEAQIINADRQRGDIVDRLKEINLKTDTSECKRRILENREVEGDAAITKLEHRLKKARETYDENLRRSEEAERRLASLTNEYNSVCKNRQLLKVKGSKLEKEIDAKILKLRDREDLEMRMSKRECRAEDQLKLLESFYRDAEEKREVGRVKVMRLQTLVEKQQGITFFLCVGMCVFVVSFFSFSVFCFKYWRSEIFATVECNLHCDRYKFEILRDRVVSHVYSLWEPGKTYSALIMRKTWLYFGIDLF